MTGERDIPLDPVGRPPGTPQDDEPTLETLTPAEDDDPTLDTTTQELTGEQTEETVASGTMPENTMEIVTPKVTGWASRLEQLTAAKHERRRRVITRFWLAVAPVIVLLVIAVVLLAVYGGQEEGAAVVSTSTTYVHRQVEGSGMLLVTRGDELSWAVMLAPWDSGGVVLTVPGITLLESGGVFKTLTETYARGDADSVEAALSMAMDVSVGPVAVVDWSDLKKAAQGAGIQGLSDESLGVGQGENDPLAAAVRTLVGEYDAAASGGPWTEMGLEGETAEFLRTLALDNASMAEEVWTIASLAGTVVVGDGFTYLDPDVDEAKALLAIADEVVTISVEIKDGAGLESAPRRAGSLVESGGFVLAPMGYAEDYPAVEKTQVFASSELLDEARQIQALLGVGEVVEDETMAADRILVVLGKDFSGESD